MRKSKSTKKSAAVKRKNVIQQSANVAQFRELLKQAAGALIALDALIDRMIADKR